MSKSSPLPVREEDPPLTYGILKDALKGESVFPLPLILLLIRLCTGFFDVMYRGVEGADPLPFGCYCNIEDEQQDVVGTAVIWPAPMPVEEV